MKIDLTDKIEQLAGRTTHSPKKQQSTQGFDSVLQDSLQKSNSPVPSCGRSIQPPMGPMALNVNEAKSMKVGSSVVQGLLNQLESYQQMLADPSATLKMIQPVITRMEQEVAGTRELVGDIPEGHPLGMILEETIRKISQEVEKFRSGHYVDS